MAKIPENIPEGLAENLAEKWLKGTITPEEQALFDQWYEAQADEEIIVDASSRAAFRELMLSHIQPDEQKKEQKQQQQQEVEQEQTGIQPQTLKKPATAVKRLWLVTAVAAALCIAFGLYKYLGQTDLKIDPSMRIAQTVPPGGNKAMLTLDNGQTIILDEAQNGLLFSQGNLSISKADSGLLIYTTQGSDRGGDPDGKSNNKITPDSKISYNTLSTPKGGKYSLALPDGTKVWLNAASSIRYPTAFTGQERKVEIKGEAYFEVVHNDKMPFRVQVGQVLVEDLGTQFVINGYTDEPELKVSLIEGAVKIFAEPNLNHAAKGKVLQPGQQASVDQVGQMRIIQDADVTGALAWKNGLFNFAGSDLKNIMRQLERWYDIKVEYAPGLPSYQFGGQTYMNASLSEVLKVLALSGIHFTVKKAENQQPVQITIEP